VTYSGAQNIIFGSGTKLIVNTGNHFYLHFRFELKCKQEQSCFLALL